MTEEIQKEIDDLELEIEAVEEQTDEEFEEDNPEEEQEVDNEEDTSGESDDDDEEEKPFPKKAVNAISRKNKQLTKYRARIQELERQMLQQQEAQTQPQEQAPREEDFDTYTDFKVAEARYQTKQEILKQAAEQQAKQRQQQQEQQSAQWAEKRIQEIGQKANEYRNASPEVKALLDQNLDLADDLPPQIQQVFLEADDPALAFAALAKEGALLDLADMTPTQAARELARAEIRGKELLKQKTSKAPTPPTHKVKGTNSTFKSPTSMNDDEFDAWLAS